MLAGKAQPFGSSPGTSIDHAMTDTTQFHVRHLERLPLGTTYPGIVEHVQRLMNRAPLVPTDTLVIDYTGCGRPAYDIFVSRGMSPIGVAICSGDSVNFNGLTYTVPKGLLIARVTALLHEGRLKIAKELADAPALVEELGNFRATVTESGRWTYGARSGAHDDLVLALAIALWRAHGGDVPGMAAFDYMRLQKRTAGTRSEFFVGVDLGQSSDSTAIAVVEKITPPTATADATHAASPTKDFTKRIAGGHPL